MVLMILVASWREIAKELGVGTGTVRRTSQEHAKNLCGAISEHAPEVLHV
jgi:hypothetical protein